MNSNFRAGNYVYGITFEERYSFDMSHRVCSLRIPCSIRMNGYCESSLHQHYCKHVVNGSTIEDFDFWRNENVEVNEAFNLPGTISNELNTYEDSSNNTITYADFLVPTNRPNNRTHNYGFVKETQGKNLLSIIDDTYLRSHFVKANVVEDYYFIKGLINIAADNGGSFVPLLERVENNDLSVTRYDRAERIFSTRGVNIGLHFDNDVQSCLFRYYQDAYGVKYDLLRTYLSTLHQPLNDDNIRRQVDNTYRELFNEIRLDERTLNSIEPNMIDIEFLLANYTKNIIMIKILEKLKDKLNVNPNNAYNPVVGYLLVDTDEVLNKL